MEIYIRWQGQSGIKTAMRIRERATAISIKDNTTITKSGYIQLNTIQLKVFKTHGVK